MPETQEIGVKLSVELPVKVIEIIRKLIENGDYKSVSDFLSEAARGYLNTWYPKTWNPKEA